MQAVIKEVICADHRQSKNDGLMWISVDQWVGTEVMSWPWWIRMGAGGRQVLEECRR